MKEIKMKKKHTKKQKIYALLALVLVGIVAVLFVTVGIPMIRDYKNSGYNSNYIYDDVSLVGIWREKSFENDTYMVYDFKDNGNVKLSMSVCGIEATLHEHATYRIEGKNELIVTYENSNHVIESTKTRFSISKDGTSLVLRDMDFTVLEKYTSEYNRDSEIIGTWSNDSASFILENDYSGAIRENSLENGIVFSTKGDKLFVFIDENLLLEGYTLSHKFVLEYEYKIENDTLSLKGADGKTTTYQRRK